MHTYRVKLEIDVQVEAFDEKDALDYSNDMFGIDDQIQKVKVISIKEHQAYLRRSLDMYGETYDENDFEKEK